ncbi:MAG: glycosyl hydrolase [Bacteroidetes bacterium]|nr:MAG: glycosyl hydrolase [Bacteroidota bacterium]PTM12741.1 MAG: glycosyl hydrolase [Bacteroidota bacterium]
MYKSILILLLVLGIHTLEAQSRWTTAAEEKAITDLMAQMTLAEKVGQMTLFTSDWDQTGPTLREGYREDIKTGKVGAIFNAHTADYNRELQRISVEETRLGIPLIFGYDVVHGYRTIFPIPLGEAASWNVVSAQENARIAAREAASAGLHWTFAPMVDVARDARWGRVMEGAGEDVYLGQVMARARVKGFQGDDLADPFTVVACAKHFAAYGAAQAGRDYHTVDISERSLREIYLPPFKTALDAGVGTFMTSFNEVDGVPASGNHHLLTDILRNEWGFEGFVVTDYTSINEMIPHGIVANEAEAGELAANAGVDMDMQGAIYYNNLVDQVANDLVSLERVDEAVREILRIKYALGLFDDPYRYNDLERQRDNIFTADHIAAARAAARESLVLLKNDQQTLPLAKTIKKLAVIGPLAISQEDMLGAWHADGRGANCVSVLSGIQEALGKGAAVTYLPGVPVVGDDATGIPAAVAAAKLADAVIVVAGENWTMSGEAASRTDINLPGRQAELIRQLHATGTPVIVVLLNGRPLALTDIVDYADAILEAWYPGTAGGQAIADIVFGDYAPAGKLPITFPRSVGQIPIYYNMKNTGRPLDFANKYTSKYLDESNDPLFPFGFGLTYTTFSFGTPEATVEQSRDSVTISVSIDVTNTGKRAGREVVQLYIRDLVGSVTRPVRELKAFQLVDLAAGERQTVQFSLTAEDLSFLRRDMSWGMEPGAFDIFIGNDSRATQRVSVVIE